MPEVTPRPKPRRVDVGNQGFIAPISEDDRDGPGSSSSNSAAIEQMPAYDPYMYDPYMMYGGYDPYAGYLGSQVVQDPWLGAEDEKWADVSQTTLETLQESGMLRRYGEDAVLVIANGPEDMKQLNHDAEAENIASRRGEDQETVVLWNPSPDALAAMLKDGGFKDVVISGHGEEGTVNMTGADGTAVAVDGTSLAAMFHDTEVENVFLNVCHGAGGQNSVAQSLAQAGLNAMGWIGTVGDGEAQQGAAEWAALTTDGASVEDMHAVSEQFGGLETVAEKAPAAAPEALTTGPADEPVYDPMQDLYGWDQQQYMWV